MVGTSERSAAAGTWVDVSPVPDALVVNIGDLLEQWTNGVFKSTRHRVVNLVPGRERYSCAFFTSPDYDTVVRMCHANSGKSS